MVRSPNAKAYTYLWASSNPVSSRFPGVANHCTDMIYTSGLYHDELSEENRRLSILMMGKWLAFVNGMEPWRGRQPGGYDLTITRTSQFEHLDLYANSKYRRVEAQDCIVQDIDRYGDILRSFLED